MSSNYLNILVSALFGMLLWMSGVLFITALGLGFTLYVFVKLLMEMGRTIPIVELMASLASLQWILGPFLEYGREIEHYRYRMYVDELTYMSFVVPAIVAFWVGANLFQTHTNLDDLKRSITRLLDKYPLFPYVLIVLGIVIPLLSGLLPSSLRFVFFLLSNMKYIGVIYLLHSTHRFRWHIFIGVSMFLVSASLATGFFHDLLLWSMLLFTFLAKELRLNFGMKVLAAVVGIVFAMTLQAVKGEYRAMTWGQSYQGSKVRLFFSIVGEQWATGAVFMPESDVSMNVRLNQGWIISSIMYNVPALEPFANGRTIKEGVVGSLVPRIFAPNKPIAGGRENFRKFTGLNISEGTSMGISIAGEGYANFGWAGGILFMFLWGLFINWFWRFLERMSRFFPTLLVWSPILFLQVIKAETEFGVVLNHLIKATVVVFGVVWIIRTFWPDMVGGSAFAEATADEPAFAKSFVKGFGRRR
jgi:hypothetical protein